MRPKINADKLRLLRLELGLTYRDLDALSGVSYVTISDLSNRKRLVVNELTVYKLSKALGCEPKDLIIQE